MKHIQKEEIAQFEKVYRLNLINSVSGFKPVHLLGTKSESGCTNLAVISSVVHLGSNPALIGFMHRPLTVSRHSYDNMMENSVYTLNQIKTDHIEAAHYTSAKFDKDVSEFNACGFTEYYLDGFNAPFVEESPLKIGLKLIDKIEIPQNGCILMIGQVEHILVDESAIKENGQVRLDELGLSCLSGLNSYYQPSFLKEMPYARVEDWYKKQNNA